MVNMRFSRFFRRSHCDAERASEIPTHLDFETDDNIGRGMPAVEARVGPFYSSPLIANGVVCIGSGDGYLYALG